jgi:hypothetical protein
MSELVTWNNDIDYDTIWFVVGQITNQISGRGIKALEEKLEDEGLVMTGDLKKSLFREVRQNNSAWLTELAMQFEAYGRFKDMKELHYTKQAPVDAMEKFVTKVMEGQVKNSTPFNFISGRPNGSMPRNRETAIRQLAWAIARSRLYQPIVIRKGKGWYIKNYMKEIYGEIETNIQAAAAQAVLNTVAKALQDRK